MTMGRVVTLFIPLTAIAFVFACSQVKKGESTTTSAAVASAATAGSMVVGPDGSNIMQVTPAGVNPVATTATTTKATSKSNISFTSTEFDWGAVNEGEKIEHRFAFTNSGTETLEVLEAKPGCGCTVTDFSRSVEPGGEGYVLGTVNSANMKGKQTKYITVHTNSEASPEIKLTLTGEINPVLEVQPQSVGFEAIDVVNGKVVGDHTKIVTVAKGAALQGGFNITEAKLAGNEDWITVKTDKKPDGSYLITLDLIEDKALAAAQALGAQNPNAAQNGNMFPFNATLTITTDIAGQAAKTIGINGSFSIK
jgi:hypothetical protein